jgi:hypothetical protein
MTFSKMTLSIRGLLATLSIMTLGIPSDVMLSVIILNVIILSAFMLSVVMLNVVMLNVVAPSVLVPSSEIKYQHRHFRQRVNRGNRCHNIQHYDTWHNDLIARLNIKDTNIRYN